MSVPMPRVAEGLRIGEAAHASGVSAANIRYYEKQGLMAPQGRGDNSYRLYSDADVHTLRFIRLCRAMDMSLDEVRTLLNLDLAQKADCLAADAALASHIAHVAERLVELQGLAAGFDQPARRLRRHRAAMPDHASTACACRTPAA